MISGKRGGLPEFSQRERPASMIDVTIKMEGPKQRIHSSSKKENDMLENIREDAVELWHTYHGDC
jgi:hypothetical protein